MEVHNSTKSLGSITSSTPEADRDPLSCSICKKRSVNPKFLPCLHSFCYQCIKKLPECGELNCPDCFASFQFLTKEEDYVTDYTKQIVSDSSDATKCDLCSSEENLDGFCVNCEISLCVICRQAHSRQSATKDHVINKLQNWTVTCSIHSEEPCAIFCLTCSQLCCRECCLTIHRKCETQFVEEVDGPLVHQFAAKLDENDQLINELSDKLDEAEKRKETIEREAEFVTQQVTEYFDKYIEAIKKHSEEVAKNVASQKTADLLKMDEMIGDLKALGQDVETATDVGNCAADLGGAQMVQMLPVLNERFTNLHLKASRLEPIQSMFSVGFDPSKEVLAGEMSFRGDLESKVSARKCNLTQNFKAANVNEPFEFTLDTSSCSVPISPRDVSVNIRHKKTQESGKYKIRQAAEGNILLKFLTNNTGHHEIRVSVNGHLLSECPLKVSVRSRRASSRASTKNTRDQLIQSRPMSPNESISSHYQTVTL